MQPVLKRGSIDKPQIFYVGLIQLSFSYQSVYLIHAIFQSNCAEGLHFSAFHYSSYDGLRGCGQCGCGFIPQTILKSWQLCSDAPKSKPKRPSMAMQAIPGRT